MYWLSLQHQRVVIVVAVIVIGVVARFVPAWVVLVPCRPHHCSGPVVFAVRACCHALLFGRRCGGPDRGGMVAG